MITVILEDGTEVPVTETNALVPVSPYGQDDKLVAIYRMPERVWTLGFLSTLAVGDCFRKLDQPETESTVFVVMKAPRMFKVNVLGVFRGWSIHMEGLTITQLSALPTAHARKLLGAPDNREVITSHTRLLLENSK